jgi:alpha-aminoadipate carrier protein LysW
VHGKTGILNSKNEPRVEAAAAAPGARNGRNEPMVNCPLCDAGIDVDEEELDEGDVLICEECGTNLTVNGLSPLELVSGESDEDEDEDDDFDEDYDDEEDEEEEDDEEE